MMATTIVGSHWPHSTAYIVIYFLKASYGRKVLGERNY